ncbi:MAG: hypothetical protein WC998_01500 [Candidatus Paceibacterota bacterium]|jgi:hypothetical protein
MSDKDIQFQATVFKVQTLVDGGIRITMDLSENEIEAMAKLVLCHKANAVLEITAIPLINKSIKEKETELENGSSKGKVKQSRWQTPQEQSTIRTLTEGS